MHIGTAYYLSLKHLRYIRRSRDLKPASLSRITSEGALMGRIVIVTGANGALGSVVTQKFLANGDTVIGVSRDIQSLQFEGNFTRIAAELADAPSVQKPTD